MRYVSGFGMVSGEERRRADQFFESLVGIRARRAPLRWPEADQEDEQDAPAAPQPYLPQGGRNFTPQNGVFNCAPTPFTVIPASFLPARTADPDAAIDAALTASGLNAAQRRQITPAGLRPIATEFGTSALTELIARLRWPADDIVQFGQGTGSMLAPRLLIHVPGHFRELARRAPDAREAFVLECTGWLLMAGLRTALASAIRKTVWVPPAPPWVTAVPNPVPPVTREVSQLLLRYLLVDTTMTADQWNMQLVAWGTGLAGRQWQAEVAAPQPGRPFYASLATIPAHVSTVAVRAAYDTAWQQKRADADARHAPHAAAATTITLDGLLNAIELRADNCDNDNPHLPTGLIGSLQFPGLQMAYDFPRPKRTVTGLPLMRVLHPVYTALFSAIRDLGWNDLLFECEGGACFRGVHHSPTVKVTVGGTQIKINPFKDPDATMVTRLNTLATAGDRTIVVNACRAARTLSQHGLGAAIDFNVPENQPGSSTRPFGSMDPRIVAIFEAFHFRFGGCFNPRDPMHFEYCETPCAPASANAGTLGRVITPRMLLPLRATDRVLA